MRIVGGKLMVLDQCIACKPNATNGFSSIADVLLHSEMESIAKHGNRLAGFGKNCLRSHAA